MSRNGMLRFMARTARKIATGDIHDYDHSVKQIALARRRIRTKGAMYND